MYGLFRKAETILLYLINLEVLAIDSSIFERDCIWVGNYRPNDTELESFLLWTIGHMNPTWCPEETVKKRGQAFIIPCLFIHIYQYILNMEYVKIDHDRRSRTR